MFYAVKVGHNPGVYTTWGGCYYQIKDYYKPVFSICPTLPQAWAFVSELEIIQPKLIIAVRWILHFDGGSRGNPGPSGVGAVILHPLTGEIVSQVSKFIGHHTCNEAEYIALIEGLKACISLDIKHVRVEGDSNLIISQMNKVWRVRKPALIKLHQQATDLLVHFEDITFRHIYREANTLADALATRAMDLRR